MSNTPVSDPADHAPISSRGFCYFQRRFMPVEEANINIMTHAFLYGTAVFEGIRGYSSASDPGRICIFRAEEHFTRLKRSAQVLKMRLPAEMAEMLDLTRQLVAHSGYRCDVYLRPLIYKSALRIGVQLDDQQEFAMFVLPWGRKYPQGAPGVNVGISSWRRLEDNAIPSRAKINGSYVNIALGTDEVHANGLDEPLLLSEDGHLAEAAGMNVFLVRNGELITPGEHSNILEGITRDSLWRLAEKELGLRVIGRDVDRSELYAADEMFLCGTGAEILPVASVDRRPIGTGQPGAITCQLMQLYGRVVRGEVDAYRHWLLPVVSA